MWNMSRTSEADLITDRLHVHGRMWGVKRAAKRGVVKAEQLLTSPFDDNSLAALLTASFS